MLVLPYVHMLSPDIRKSLFERLELAADDFVVIVDEAHNLIDAAREEESFALWASELDGVEAETRQYGKAWLAKVWMLTGSPPHLRDTSRRRQRTMQGALEARLGRRFLEGRLRES